MIPLSREMTDSATPVRREPVFRWYLESLVEGGRQLRRKTLHPLHEPFRVGRLPGLGLSLDSESVSKVHAEFSARSGELHVRDLRSRNGTFVNRERVTHAVLREGDILHFAQLEFRVGRQEIEDGGEGAVEPATERWTSGSSGSLGEQVLPQQFVQGVHELPALLRERQVTVVFQPVVSLPSGTLAGFEALGRGRHPRLPEMPLDLFDIAAGIGAQAELSEVFRQKALELVEGRGGFPALFLNVHHAEIEREALVPSIVAARKSSPQLRLNLELRERALAPNLDGIRRLRSRLEPSRVGIAYDNFGAGQARLLELAEEPPEYLKFDMTFVRGISTAPPRRRQLLTSLVTVARDLLVYTVAEGVETAEEADVCMHIGFTHAQGFYFGRPRPVDEL